MDSKRERLRRPVVCNVCRRRKIRCDRGKPACGACKKSGISHLCIYEEPGEGTRLRGPARGLDDYADMTPSPPPAPRRPVGRPPKNPLLIEQQRQLKLKQQQLQQRLLQQQSLQNQMAAKYGLTGGHEGLENGVNGFGSNPQLSSSIVDFQAQLLNPGPPTYAIDDNLQREWRYLKNRMLDVEKALGVPPSLTPDQSQTEKPSIEFESNPKNIEEDSENIDPSLFDPDELLSIHQNSISLPDSLDLNVSGLFGDDTVLRKDVFQILFQLNLIEYEESSSNHGKSRSQRGDKFDIYLNNKHERIEHAFKHSPTSVDDLVKRTAQILPTKKITWLMIDKFFNEISDSLVTVLDEASFTEEVSRIIETRELVDQKVSLRINVDNNYHIISLAYLVIIIRIVQLSLLTTEKLDKQDNFLLKNSQISNDYDSVIEVLFVLLENFDIDQVDHFRLQSFKSFLHTNNFYADNSVPPYDYTSLTNSIDKIRVAENEILRKAWYNLYYNYNHQNSSHGLPIFIPSDFFKLEQLSTEQRDFQFLQSEFLNQVKINDTIKNLINKLNLSSNSGIQFSVVKKLLKKYDDVIISDNSDFQTLKRLAFTHHSEKFRKTKNYFNYILIKLNVIFASILHYENNPPKDKSRLWDQLTEFFETLRIGITDAFDLLRNHTIYYYPGYELVLFPLIVNFFERTTKTLINIYLRSAFTHKDSLSILILLTNINEELEGFPTLNNYFGYWKTSKRTKSAIHLFKKAQYDGNLTGLFGFNPNFRFNEKIITNHIIFNDKDVERFEEIVSKVNERFDTKYSKAPSIDDFFGIYDAEEPLFDIRLFR